MAHTVRNFHPLSAKLPGKRKTLLLKASLTSRTKESMFPHTPEWVSPKGGNSPCLRPPRIAQTRSENMQQLGNGCHTFSLEVTNPDQNNTRAPQISAVLEVEYLINKRPRQTKKHASSFWENEKQEGGETSHNSGEPYRANVCKARAWRPAGLGEGHAGRTTDKE